jgi:oligo-1,6-glucosidase
MNENYVEINVEEQEKRADSVLSFYKQALALRKKEEYKEPLVYGRFVPAFEEMDGVFAYLRVDEESGQQILIAGNYGEQDVVLHLNELDGIEFLHGTVLLSNVELSDARREEIEEGKIVLGSCEGLVVQLH